MNGINNINLSKLNKCDQRWDKMPENDLGRICTKCQHSIIDFRNKSKGEIAKAHIFSETKVCGLYSKDQLKTSSKEKSKSRLTTYSASVYLSLIGFISLPSAVSAQREKPRVVQSPISENKATEIQGALKDRTASDSITFLGIIRDFKNDPVPLSNVYLQGSSIGTTSNFEGEYQLTLPVKMDSTGTMTLVFKALGYADKKIRFNADNLRNASNINLDVQIQEDDIIAFGVEIKQPIHKRLWHRFVGWFR